MLQCVCDNLQDKTPAPLNQLDVVMDETYHQLVSLADDMEKAQAKVSEAGQALGAAVQLMLQLIRCEPCRRGAWLLLDQVIDAYNKLIMVHAAWMRLKYVLACTQN